MKMTGKQNLVCRVINWNLIPSALLSNGLTEERIYCEHQVT